MNWLYGQDLYIIAAVFLIFCLQSLSGSQQTVFEFQSPAWSFLYGVASAGVSVYGFGALAMPFCGTL